MLIDIVNLKDVGMYLYRIQRSDFLFMWTCEFFGIRIGTADVI